MNWQDKEGAAGAVATPEVAAGLPVVSRDGKTYTFTIKPGLPVLERPARQRAELRRRVQPLREPADAVDGRAVPRHRPGRPGRDRRQGAHDLGRPGEGNKLTVRLTKASPDFLARLTMPFMQAIDPKLARQIDANGINQYASCGPYYFSIADAGPLDHPQAEPALQGRPCGERRHDPGQRRQRHRRAVPERRERARRTTPRRASRRPSGRTSSRSTG